MRLLLLATVFISACSSSSLRASRVPSSQSFACESLLDGEKYEVRFKNMVEREVTFEFVKGRQAFTVAFTLGLDPTGTLNAHRTLSIDSEANSGRWESSVFGLKMKGGSYSATESPQEYKQNAEATLEFLDLVRSDILERQPSNRSSAALECAIEITKREIR